METEMNRCPVNQTVSFSTYTAAIRTQVRAPETFIRQKMARIEQAFDMGEPIWMIVQELQMVRDMTPPARTKTPRQLAARVVTV